jgi:hypothetical protein
LQQRRQRQICEAQIGEVLALWLIGFGFYCGPRCLQIEFSKVKNTGTPSQISTVFLRASKEAPAATFCLTLQAPSLST